MFEFDMRFADYWEPKKQERAAYQTTTTPELRAYLTRFGAGFWVRIDAVRHCKDLEVLQSLALHPCADTAWDAMRALQVVPAKAPTLFVWLYPEYAHLVNEKPRA